MKAKRAAIYARVSTDENRQDPETQLRELRDFAERRGFEVVGEYIDHASGKTEERESYKRLLEDARRRRLDVVLVWRYDRFARSTVALVNALAEFRSLGVDFSPSRRTWIPVAPENPIFPQSRPLIEAPPEPWSAPARPAVLQSARQPSGHRAPTIQVQSLRSGRIRSLLLRRLRLPALLQCGHILAVR